MFTGGERLQNGRYIVQRVLDRGGMGTVYLGVQPALGDRRIAIKEMTVDIQDPDERRLAIQQFTREAEILGTLNHSGLVNVSDCFEENGHQYLVMSFVEGQTLEALMQAAPGFLPVSQVLDWADQVAQILDYLHRRRPRVIFRDLKPSNVMLDTDGRVRLIDFGIARLLEGENRTSTFIRWAGTPGFAPVEQYSGGGSDPRTDIYAFGATLYRLLTRTTPPVSVALLSGEAALTPPSAVNAAVPVSFEAVVVKMMGVSKEARYESAEAVRRALQACSTAVPGEATTPLVQVCEVCRTPRPADTIDCPQCASGDGRERGSTLPTTQVAPSAERPPAPVVPQTSPVDARGHGSTLPTTQIAPLFVQLPCAVASVPDGSFRVVAWTSAQGAMVVSVACLAVLVLFGSIRGDLEFPLLLVTGLLAAATSVLGGVLGHYFAHALQTQLGTHRVVQALTACLGGALGAALAAAVTEHSDWLVVGPAAACVGGLLSGALRVPVGRVVAAAMVGGFLGVHVWHSFPSSFYDNIYIGSHMYSVSISSQDWYITLSMGGACAGTVLGLIRPRPGTESA